MQELKPGDFVAGYQIIQELGKGGMAHVFRARKVGIGGSLKACAIKVMRRDVAKDEWYRGMFLREARYATMLNSPNIVQTFEVGNDPKHGLFLAMEWVQGQNLSIIRTLLDQRGKRMPIEVAAYVIGEILAALHCAHNVYAEGRATGLIHRDVTPQNVLVGHDGSVKLADFGVARTQQDESSMVAKGKIRYMAREHFEGKVTQQSDLFGVGAILDELLRGKRFRSHAESDAQLFAAIMSGDTWRAPIGIPDPSRGELVPVPRGLQRVLDGLLEPEETKRLSTAAAALELLEQWDGYRPARRALAHLYGQLFGEEATKTVTGGTAMFEVDLDDPEIARRRAELQAQVASPVATRTKVLPGEGPQPRLPPTIEFAQPVSGTVPLAPPPPRRFKPVVTALRRLRWWGVAMLAAPIVGVPIGLLIARLSTEGAPQQGALPSPGTQAEVSAPEHPPALVEPAVGGGPIIPEPPPEQDVPTAEALEPASSPAPSEPSVSHIAAPDPVTNADQLTQRPAAKPSAPTAKPSGPEVIVHFRLADLPKAQVKLDDRVYRIDPHHTAKVPSGTYTVRSRAAEGEAWSRAKRMKIEAGTEWIIRVGPSGPELVDFKKAFQ